MDKSPESVIHVFYYPRPRLLRSVIPRVINVWSKSGTALEYIANRHPKSKTKLIKAISPDHGHCLQIFVKQVDGQPWLDQVSEHVYLDYITITSNLHLQHKRQHKKNIGPLASFDGVEGFRVKTQTHFANVMGKVINNQLGKDEKVDILKKNIRRVEIKDNESCAVLQVEDETVLRIIHPREIKPEHLLQIEAFLSLWRSHALEQPKKDRPKTDIN